MDAKNSAVSWNWPACLVNLFWFAYRKIWPAMIGLVVLWALIIFVGLANPQLGTLMNLVGVGVTFVTGAFGNQLYRKQVNQLIESTSGLERPARIEALTSRAGVSRAAVFVLVGIVALVTLLLVLAAVAQMRRQQPVDPVPGPGPAPLNQLTGPGGVPPGDKPPIDPNDPSFQQDEGQQEILEQPLETQPEGF